MMTRGIMTMGAALLLLAGCTASTGGEDDERDAGRRPVFGPSTQPDIGAGPCAVLCVAASTMYQATVCRREDGPGGPRMECVVRAIDGAEDAGRPPEAAGTGPCGEACRCVAAMGDWEWDWVFEWTGELPSVECEPVDERWMPCGCGTRIDFREGSCARQPMTEGSDG